MATDAWVVYDIFTEEIGKGNHSLDGDDVIKFALLEVGYTPNKVTDVDFAVIDADEFANGDGYTSGGVAAAATWDTAASILTFDAADGTITAAGDDLVFRYIVAWNSSKGGSNDLIAYCLADNTPADVTILDGTPLVMIPHTDGILTIP